MMRERAAAAKDLFAGNIFELEIDLRRIFDALVIKAEIKIDRDTGAVNLRDTRGHKRLSGETAFCVFVAENAFYVIAYFQRIAP